MIINAQSLKTVTTSFNAAFNKGWEKADKLHKEVAIHIPSGTATEEYGWLGQMRGMKEWIGPRIVGNLRVSSFAIKNRLFQDSVSIPRTAIEDDQYGLYAPVLEEMGRAAATHPDELVFALLKNGFNTNCYDGQFFFDTDHPVENDATNTVASVSNMQAGAGAGWFLLDNTRPMRAVIFQERIPYELQRVDRSEDQMVFTQDEFLYGVRARGDAGYGLWQMAFGSKATLNAANYKAARAAMMSLTGEGGRPLNIKPTVLVVPPALEGEALQLLNSEYGTGGVTNEWKGTAKLIVTPLVA